MSYLGLDLDNLCWEIKSLMQNNYDREVTKKNLNLLFTYAKNDILEIFKDIINQNKEEVLNDFKEHLESLEDD